MAPIRNIPKGPRMGEIFELLRPIEAEQPHSTPRTVLDGTVSATKATHMHSNVETAAWVEFDGVADLGDAGGRPPRLTDLPVHE